MADAASFHAGAGEAFNAGDPESVKRAQQAAELREVQRKQVIASNLATPQGREFWWHVLNDCHVWEKRVPMSGSEREDSFYEGEREAGLRFLRLFCRTSPTDFALMISENDNG